MNPAEVAAQVVALIKQQAPGAEGRATVSFGRNNETRFAANEITTAGDVEVTRIAVTVARGKRHATASHNRLEPAALSDLVKRAATMASLAPEDPEWMGVLGPQALRTPTGAFDAATFALSSDVRAEAAKKVIAAADGKGVVAAGFYSAGGATSALATTAGLVASHSSSEASLTVSARNPEGTGSGWAGAERVAASELDASALAAVAVDKAVRSQKPGAAEPKPWKVVLDPACVAEMLAFFLDALDARRADEGRSFFSKKGGGTRLGEKMFAPGITLKGDPFDPATPASPYDGEGLAIEPTTFVENGTLRSLVTSRFWANKTGTQPRPRPTAVHLLGGEAQSVEQLIAMVDRGLYVTRFWYTRWLDPQTMTITGLTRDGVFLIEKGVIKGPVNNFRFNESPAAVLAKAKAWTQETARVPARGPVMRVPAILTEDFHMASVSAAV
ncbi:MAG TPA: TldD/PmbA family protein [Polyangiaceae bacterium]|nr:TldD/PmbA family protein [Polyangiaceae bacterium]